MTFAPIALADLPEVVKGAKAKTLTDADTAIANAVIAILKTGNAAQSSDAFASKAAAESAARKMTTLLARVTAAPAGQVYRFRAISSGTTVAVAAVAAVPATDTKPAVAAVPAKSVLGTTFAIVYGNPPKPRATKATA